MNKCHRVQIVKYQMHYKLNYCYYYCYYYYYNRFMALWILSGATRVCQYRKG